MTSLISLSTLSTTQKSKLNAQWLNLKPPSTTSSNQLLTALNLSLGLLHHPQPAKTSPHPNPSPKLVMASHCVHHFLHRPSPLFSFPVTTRHLHHCGTFPLYRFHLPRGITTSDYGLQKGVDQCNFLRILSWNSDVSMSSNYHLFPCRDFPV